MDIAPMMEWGANWTLERKVKDSWIGNIGNAQTFGWVDSLKNGEFLIPLQYSKYEGNCRSIFNGMFFGKNRKLVEHLK